jgi:hypothetical protein
LLLWTSTGKAEPIAVMLRHTKGRHRCVATMEAAATHDHHISQMHEGPSPLRVRIGRVSRMKRHFKATLRLPKSGSQSQTVSKAHSRKAALAEHEAAQVWAIARCWVRPVVRRASPTRGKHGVGYRRRPTGSGTPRRSDECTFARLEPSSNIGVLVAQRGRLTGVIIMTHVNSGVA